jgi:hypothetical protein
MVNKFYSLAEVAKAAKSFDLADLGATVTRMTPFGFLNSNGTLEGFDEFEVAVTAADYDEEFLKKLLKISPAYAIGDFLTHHFDYFLTREATAIEFIHHIEHVILVKVKHHTNPMYATLITEWLTTQKYLMFSQNKQQRLAFLEAAYRAACDYAPAQPLSVSINPTELGNTLGLDRATVSRIVTELVQDNQVSSTLGMKSMMITREGVRQLEGEQEKPPVQQSFHFAQGSTSSIATGVGSVQVTNTGRNAQVNVASGGAMQQATNGVAVQALGELLQQLRQVLAAEPKLEAQQEEISDELHRIDVQLRKPEPKKSIIARSFEVLQELAKDGLGATAGHAAFELLQQVPHLLHSVTL